MTDITKCAGTGCADKHQCKRFTAPANSHQSWAEFYKNHQNCLHYLSMAGNKIVSKSVLKRIEVQKN